MRLESPALPARHLAPPRPERPMTQAYLVLLAINLIRLAFSFGFDLFPQEAYYFFYSQHPALSYFDHPPVLAWALHLFARVLGPSELAIRLTAFTLTLATQVCFVALTARFLPAARRARTVVLFATTLLVSTLSLISTPDVPLLLFWSLSLLQLHRAIFEEKRWAWLLAGLFMGLAFDSKYTGIFLQGGMGLFLVASPRHRRWLRTPWPWLSILLAQAAMLPVYIWNYQHQFASFLFQSANRAAGMGRPTARFFLGLLATQSALLLPPLLFALVLLAVPRLKLFLKASKPSRDKPLFLLCFFAPLALLFTGVSMVSLVKPNWLMPAYVTGVLFVGLFASRRLVRWNLALSAALHVVAIAQLLFYIVPIKSDDTYYGWRELARQVAQLRAANAEAFVFSDDNYKTTAELTFYMREKVYGSNVLGKRALEYDYVGDDLQALAGRDALFIDSAPSDSSPSRASSAPPELIEHFREVVQLDPVLVLRGEAIARKFFVYRCAGYLGPAGRPIASEGLR